MKLRPYQTTTIADTARKLAKSKRVILCAPTGSGKTVMFSTIVTRYLAKNLFNRVLIVTDRVELLTQTFASIHRAGVRPAVFSADTHKATPLHNERCVVAMIETLKRRGIEQLGGFELIIIDEAHKGNFRALFDIYPDAMVIGATATPLATSKKDPLKNYFNDISECVGIPQLVQDKFLAPAKTYAMRLVDPKRDLVKAGGEYTTKSQTAAFTSGHVFEGLLKAYHAHCANRKTIVFCSSVEASEQTYAKFRAEGVETYIVTSTMAKKDRDAQMAKYHASRVGVMVNCGILTTGYDHPPISAVIMNRATLSLPLWLQCCGRGSRIAEGKKDFKIIDMGSNVFRHGLWEQDRSWSELFHTPPPPGKRSEDVAPVKECCRCEAIIPASARACNYCGAKQPATAAQKKEGELIRIQDTFAQMKGKQISELSVEELGVLQTVKGYKLGFITRILRARGMHYLMAYARMKGYSPGWVRRAAQGPKSFSDFTVS